MSPTADFHAMAAREAVKSYRWYLRRSPQAAARFLAELDRAIQEIIDNPERHSQHLAGTQMVPLRRFPYYIVYHVDNQSIAIIAVAHGKRKRGYWRRRIRNA